VNCVQAEIRGHYLETRTCQVYTGPCFANGEMGLAGKDAVMAWNIHEGQHRGVDLRGMNVVVALSCSTTLGHEGLNKAENLRSVIYVDAAATPAQREALVDFARTHAGPAGSTVVRIESTPISMSHNELDLQGQQTAGKEVKLATRKARASDCICSNEVAFYPPLAQVESCAAGVTTVGEFKGRGLGSRWSTPESRSAYMARFAY
ncbi:MAG: DUF1326 domain-containing protein, partial [Pirellulaceae bacterium]